MRRKTYKEFIAAVFEEIYGKSQVKRHDMDKKEACNLCNKCSKTVNIRFPRQVLAYNLEEIF